MPDPLPPPPPTVSAWQKAWPYFGMAFLALFFSALALFLYNYATGIGYAKLGTIEGTRPLLVVAAIMSTIAFGGALLIGSLFSSDGTFEERFRHAREIFLVFSGVFGTVIGFYFGAGEGKAPGLMVSGDLQDSAVVAYATGGSPPYKVTLTYGPKRLTKTEETKTGWVRFQLDKEKDNIVQTQLSATDSKAAQTSAQVPLEAAALKAAGWKLTE